MLTRALRLPPASTAYRVHRELPVPMRDGVRLLADHYEPVTDQPLGTLLVRGPYGRAFPFSLIYAQIYAARGYHVVFQSVRGTFGSGGDFVPMVTEADDGADTVAWLREQPWFTGTFATIGLSYLGFTQWALLSDPPPELAAAVITVGPHDFHETCWGTGAFTLNDFLGWSEMVAHQEVGGLQRVALHFGSPRRVAAALDRVPVGEAGRSLLGEGSPWYESWIEHPDAEDPFWDPMRMTAALDRCEVPVLLLTGWQDIFLEQTIAQFRHLARRGVEVAMTVGPWSHADIVTKGASLTATETLAWLDAHLAGHPPAPALEKRRADPVRVYVTGRHRPGWADLPDWPPAAGEHLMYPGPGGVLAAAPPESGVSRFRHDPGAPTPTVGGRLLAQSAGYRDDTDLAGRGDVVSFLTAPLAADLQVAGNPVVELDYDSDNPHFDLFVRISEVDARGRSRNVTDGFRRFDRRPDAPIRVELDAIAHTFGAGSRVRLLVAGGCHPRFARNLGTGEPVISGRQMAPSTHTVRHGAASKLILPVGPIR